ncbi:MAG: Ku protein [Jiangellaceae bacterium]
MARPVWRGTISFGLVNVGVGLYSATEQRSTVRFHQFEKGTGKRVRSKLVAEGTDREVDYEDVTKGYETSGGEHVILTQEELESVAPETSRTIAIEDFVQLAEIDPIYYQKSYYLAPRDEENEHAYALLREAMDRAGLAGIATLVMRNKEYLAAIRPADEVLILNTMYFADEVRDPRKTVGRLPEEREPPKRELDAAVQLIRELETPWQPERYHDTHRERVLQLVQQKASGEEPGVEEVAQPEEKVVDLVSALQQSIDRAKSRRGGDGGDGGDGADRRNARNGGRDRRKGGEDLGSLSKQELYDRAGDLGVSGRSKMSKEELYEAVAKAS